MATRVQKVMIQPISIIFRHLQQKTPVHIWLYDHADVRLEGRVVGFDEFMNIVLEEAVEVSAKKGTRTPLGRIMLKGENITLIQTAPSTK